MEISDLVTENLIDSSDEPSPLEILAQPVRLAPGVLAEKITNSIKLIEEDPSQTLLICSRLLAWMVCSDGALYTRQSPLSTLGRTQQALPLLLHAEKAKENEEALLFVISQLESLHRSLLAEEKTARRRASIGNFSSSLQYIIQIWGDDAEKVIADITGCTNQATVRRWVRGGNAKWSNARYLHNAADVFYSLLEEKGWEKAQLVSWYDAPLASGKTPAELLRTSYQIPKEIELEIKRA